MKNLNEPLRRGYEDKPADEGQIHTDRPTDSRVVSMEDRQGRKNENRPSFISDPEAEELSARWMAIQTSFVDEPRSAVKDADELVLSAIKQISENLRNQRGQLERQWSTASQVSTEDLRLSLQQYRMFLDRLLSM